MGLLRRLAVVNSGGEELVLTHLKDDENLGVVVVGGRQPWVTDSTEGVN